MLTRIVEQLQNSRSILIGSCSMPDGNAVCSLLALGLALKLLRKRIYLHYGKRIPPEFTFLPSARDVEHEIDQDWCFDTAVILNCPNDSNDRLSAALQSQSQVLINIDHHQTNTGFGDLQLLDPGASGPTELVYRVIEKLPVQIDYPIATAIYAGILADTGSFQFRSTTPAAFGIGAEMTSLGVRPGLVAKHFYRTYPLSYIKLLNYAIDSLEITNNGKVSIVTLTQEAFQNTGAKPEDIDGIIDCARSIKGVEVAALIKEAALGWECSADRRRRFQVHLYSDTDVDVSKIAVRFGGHGDANAASFSISTKLPELKARIVYQFEKISNGCLDGQTEMHQNLVADVPWPAESRSSPQLRGSVG